jgi:hypothetical protein
VGTAPVLDWARESALRPNQEILVPESEATKKTAVHRLELHCPAEPIWRALELPASSPSSVPYAAALGVPMTPLAAPGGRDITAFPGCCLLLGGPKGRIATTRPPAGRRYPMPEQSGSGSARGPHAAAQEPGAVTLAGDAVSISITACVGLVRVPEGRAYFTLC